MKTFKTVVVLLVLFSTLAFSQGNVKMTYLGEYQADSTSTTTLTPFYIGDAQKFCLVMEVNTSTVILDSIYYYSHPEKSGTASATTPVTTATTNWEVVTAGGVTATTIEPQYKGRGPWLTGKIYWGGALSYGTACDGKVKVWAKTWMADPQSPQTFIGIGQITAATNTTLSFPAFYVGDCDSFKVFLHSVGSINLDSVYVKNAASKSATPLANHVNAMNTGSSTQLTAGTTLPNLIAVNLLGAAGGIPAGAWQWATVVAKTENSGTNSGLVRGYVIRYHH